MPNSLITSTDLSKQSNSSKMKAEIKTGPLEICRELSSKSTTAANRNSTSLSMIKTEL